MKKISMFILAVVIGSAVSFAQNEPQNTGGGVNKNKKECCDKGKHKDCKKRCHKKSNKDASEMSNPSSPKS